MLPASHLRAVRHLEPPTEDEGFAELPRIPFARKASEGEPGVFVAADAWPRLQVTDVPQSFQSTEFATPGISAKIL